MDIASVTFVALLSTVQFAAMPPAAAERVRPLLAALSHPPALAGSAPMPANGSPSSRDSLKNGIIIGGVIGGVLGILAGATGCGAGGVLSMSEEEDDCTGRALLGGAILGAAGAGIGAGIDALLERAPSPTGVSQGYRGGVRVHLRW